MKRPKDVDEYIASTPKSLHGMLKELRKAIKSVAPEAEEKISYGMPYYGYNGRLAYFRLATKHLGLYIPGSIVEKYKKELKGYTTHKATIQLPLDKPLPVNLIKKLVKARVKMIDAAK